jgi:hypothetical protein
VTRNEIIGLFVAGIIFAIVLAVILLLKLVDTAQAIQIIISFVLVLITATYVKRTSDIAGATKEQAREIREQRVMASRPVIIQKAVFTKAIPPNVISDYFQIYNAGNGPAIEVEVSLLDKEKRLTMAQRESFLRAGEPPITFYPSLVNRLESPCYIVSEYQSIFSSGPQQTWYQTWLPFETRKSSKEGKIDIIVGELEFREVTEKERIDAFSRMSKPK